MLKQNAPIKISISESKSLPTQGYNTGEQIPNNIYSEITRIYEKNISGAGSSISDISISFKTIDRFLKKSNYDTTYDKKGQNKRSSQGRDIPYEFADCFF